MTETDTRSTDFATATSETRRNVYLASNAANPGTITPGIGAAVWLVSSVHPGTAMKNSTEPTKATTEHTETAIETIESVELDDVTGGCARCGCGAQTAPNLAAFVAFAATLRRRLQPGVAARQLRNRTVRPLAGALVAFTRQARRETLLGTVTAAAVAVI